MSGVCAEPEMEACVARAEITRIGMNGRQNGSCPRRSTATRAPMAKRFAWRTRVSKSASAFRGCLISKQAHRSIVIVDDNVDCAVVVEIAEGHSPAYLRDLKCSPR